MSSELQTPASKTRSQKEIVKLQQDWINSGFDFDIEDQQGFEAHREDLILWKEEYQRDRARLAARRHVQAVRQIMDDTGLCGEDAVALKDSQDREAEAKGAKERYIQSAAEQFTRLLGLAGVSYDELLGDVEGAISNIVIAADLRAQESAEKRFQSKLRN